MFGGATIDETGIHAVHDVFLLTYSQDTIVSYNIEIIFYNVIIITLAAKRRWKGTVIILCVCVSVCLCVCSQNFGKSTNIGGSNELLADFKIIQGSKITTGFC